MAVLQPTLLFKPITPLTLESSRPLRYVTFFYLYLMQGVPAGFATTAVANYLTAEGVTSSAVGTFVAAQGLPWTVQFVWGPLVDRFQSSPMGRRRPVVLLAQFMAFLASLGILFFVRNPIADLSLLATAFLIHSIFASIQDASVDAMAISIIPESERGRINAFMRGGFLIGMGLSAATLSYLLRNYSFHTAALAQSLFLLTMTVVTFFIKEKQEDALFPWTATQIAVVEGRQHKHSLGWLFRELYRGLIARQSLQLFLPILMVYISLSVFIRAYSVHMIHTLHWSDTELSFLNGTYSTAVMLAIIIIGGWLADRMGARRLLVYVLLGISIFISTAYLLSPYWVYRSVSSSLYVFYYALDPLVSVAAMPALMALCRRDVEGSQFTTYMALVNLCDAAGSFISGHIQMSVQTPVIVLGCALTLVTALLLTRRVVSTSE